MTALQVLCILYCSNRVNEQPNKIIISNIPAKAYEYVVNGKSAISWIMERYKITTHKTSSIKNDPNDWAKEVGNPRYVLDLLLSIINVSVQTVDLVKRKKNSYYDYGLISLDKEIGKKTFKSLGGKPLGYW